MINSLTKQQSTDILNVENKCKLLGLENCVRDLIIGDKILNENDYLKLNLPSTIDGFETGNGEGVWGCPLTKKDLYISKNDDDDTTFQVILLNDSIYYPFPYGTILTAKCIYGFRPVLSYKWINNIFKTHKNTTIEQYLKKEEIK